MPPETSSSTSDIYLDANATVRAFPEVIALVSDVMRHTYANPSSAHWLGSDARAIVVSARDGVASLFGGVLPEGVIFTSGGTEANNAVILAPGNSPQTLITTAVEHPSVLRPAASLAQQGGSVVILPVSGDGMVDPGAVFAAVVAARGRTTLSVQWANSETGVIQPMSDIVSEARRARPDILVHSDVAQAAGRVAIDLDAIAVDVLTFSAHKLHGPQGIGAMVLRDDGDRRVGALILGGGQERGYRSGTSNVAGAAGLGLASSMRASEFDSALLHLMALRNLFESVVTSLVPAAVINALHSPRVPNTSSVRFAGIEAMELVARLDERGIACSVGTACSAAKPEPSPTLTAMGFSESDAFSSVRFSFSTMNTMLEAERAAQVVGEIMRGIT